MIALFSNYKNIRLCIRLSSFLLQTCLKSGKQFVVIYSLPHNLISWRKQL